MIPYIEVLNKNTLKSYSLVEPSECWFELSYYDLGQFEIYCIANNHNLAALTKGAFVKIPNKRFIWFITSISYTYNANGARMIIAKGYEAKYLLNKRIIQNPLELPQNLSLSVFNLINDNLGEAASETRKIPHFYATTNSNLNIVIEPTQATRTNLYDFINNLLKTYLCGAYAFYQNGNIYFQIISGQDKTESIVFSQSQDNLLTFEYYNSDDNLKTFAEVVSKVEDIEYTKEYNSGPSGIDRNELLINSDLSTTYTNESGQEQTTTPTSSLYQNWQIEEGKKALAENATTNEAKGEIDLINSHYTFDNDFFIGDIVKIKDEYFNIAFNARINKITFKQSRDGYGEELDYREE